MAAALTTMGIGTALNIGSSLSARSDAKKEKKAQRALNRLMTAEEVRTLGKEHERVLGSAKAQIAGSGFTGYGASTAAYLDELRQEQAREIGFTKQVGANNAQVINRQGQAMQNQYGMQALSSLVGGIGQIGSAMNWGLDSYTPTQGTGPTTRYSRGRR